MRQRILVLFLLTLWGCNIGSTEKKTSLENSTEYTPLSTIATWQNEHSSNQQIFQEGTISKILQDDNEGSRHQKFIVKLNNDVTLLIAHNIDLSTRIPDIENGETIVFFGEYEWNKKGGVVHWTHKDPQGNHANGYLLYRGKRYD